MVVVSYGVGRFGLLDGQGADESGVKNNLGGQDYLVTIDCVGCDYAVMVVPSSKTFDLIAYPRSAEKVHKNRYSAGHKLEPRSNP